MDLRGAFELRLSMVMALVAACAGRESGRAVGLVEERVLRADTLVVTNVRGQRWASDAKLEEVVRIGRADGPDEYLFGRINALAARGEGPVYIYDDQFNVLRMYGADGVFVRNIGRKGSGPGEYQYIIGLALLGDGRLAGWDARGHRINVYNGAGDRLNEILVVTSQRLFTAKAFAVDTADTFYALTLFAGRLRMLHVNERGAIVDTLWYPQGQPFLGTDGLHPMLETAFHPHGYFVWGTSDRYSIHLRAPNGRPMQIERRVAAVPFTSQERSQYQAVLDGTARTVRPAERPTGEYAMAPDVKPFFTDIQVGRDGAIWVLRQTASRKRARLASDAPDGKPRVDWVADDEFDVFAADGAYLGRVPVPERVTISAIDGNNLWGTVRDADGVQAIVHYRLRVSAGISGTKP